MLPIPRGPPVKAVDWIILVGSLVFIVAWGLWKGRGQADLKAYILAGRKDRWYGVALAIMATQASAITFLSTPGQGYVDGLRFVQIYFGLPLAMVLLCVTLVPLYHRLKVYTAYEFLEKRLDPKTRVLTAALFLLQRGLAAGFTLYAPALILSVILGWNIHATTGIMGALVIVYTLSGGNTAVSHTQFQQMLICLGGMGVAFAVILRLLPPELTFLDAVRVAGASGRMDAIDLSFDPSNRYTLWSGLLGGLFLSLSYFGTDQSQVGRYLSGRSVGESRTGLLFNGLIKIPMQYFILFTGVMVFVFYQFTPPPLFFNRAETAKVEASGRAGEWRALEERHGAIHAEKRGETLGLVEARRAGDAAAERARTERIRALQDSAKAVRGRAVGVLKTVDPDAAANDTNYIFLSFVTRYLPVGVLGVVLAVIFAAAMSSISAEVTALSSTTLVDIYRRLIRKDAPEGHYLLMTRAFTLAWGLYAVLSAQLAGRMGSLIEAVNIVGSLFYGTILGIFVMAFYAKRVDGTSVFWGAVLAEACVLIGYNTTPLSYLWYNALGTLAVAAFSLALHALRGTRARAAR